MKKISSPRIPPTKLPDEEMNEPTTSHNEGARRKLTRAHFLTGVNLLILAASITLFLSSGHGANKNPEVQVEVKECTYVLCPHNMRHIIKPELKDYVVDPVVDCCRRTPLNSQFVGKGIPKIIHQSGNEKSLQSVEIQENIRYLKESNPGWEYRFYGDDDIEVFIKENYPIDYLELYEQISKKYFPAKTDFFRYLLMLKVGGVWLDLKSTATVPLDHIIDDDTDVVLSHWTGLTWQESNPPYGEFQQWHLIFSPNHPLMQEVVAETINRIKNYDIRRAGVGKAAVLSTTGPLMYTSTALEIFNRNQNRNNFKVFRENQNLALKYSIYDDWGGHESLNQNQKQHYTKQLAHVVNNGKSKDAVNRPPIGCFCVSRKNLRGEKHPNLTNNFCKDDPDSWCYVHCQERDDWAPFSSNDFKGYTWTNCVPVNSDE